MSDSKHHHYHEEGFISRREFLKAGTVIGGAALMSTLHVPFAHGAEKFPRRAITIISTSAAGGSYDRCIRSLQPEWEKRTGQPLKAIFAPGAGGQIACTKIIGNPPDGYTTGFGSITNLQIMIHFNKPKNFGPESFVYLGTISVEPLAIIVRKDAKWKNFSELYEEAKNNPINVGVATPRTYYHLAGLILKDAIGAKFNFVHYGGGGKSGVALLAGEVPVILSGLFSRSNIYDQTRGLLVLGPTNPIPETWEMPTSRDALPGKKVPEFLHQNVIFCPAEVQKKYPDRFDSLVKIFRETVESSETKERMKKAGFPAAAMQYWDPDKCIAFEKELRSKLKTLKL